MLLLAIGACKQKAPPAVPPVPVTVGKVEQRSVPFDMTATGTVEPQQTVAVEAQVGGQIMRVAFKEGDDVKQGQVLFEIDPRPYQAALAQAQAMLAKDRAQLASAQSDVVRYAALVDKDYVTAQQVEQVRTTAAALKATVDADQAAVETAQLNLQYATIRAPIGGRAGSLLVRQGNLVRSATATPLVMINQLRPILVRFAVPAVTLPQLRQYSVRPLPVRAQQATGLAIPVVERSAFWTTRWIRPPEPFCSKDDSRIRMRRSGRVSSSTSRCSSTPSPTRW